jgi:hypothetical protein
MPEIGEIQTNPKNPAQKAKWDGAQWVDASGPEAAPEWGQGAVKLPNGTIARAGPRGGMTILDKGEQPGLAGADARTRLTLGLDPAVSAMFQMAKVEGYGTKKVENPYDRDWGATLLMGKGENGSLNDWAARSIGGQDFQDYIQASKSFESVLMPIFSGAAVTDTEAQRFIRANLPERGDTIQTLQAKTRNRKMLVNAAADLLGEPKPFPEAKTWRGTGAGRQPAAAPAGAPRPAAAPARPAGGLYNGGRPVTPAEAQKLPKGTRFKGTDGVERTVR